MINLVLTEFGLNVILIFLGVIGIVFTVTGIVRILLSVRGFRKQSASNYGIEDFVDYFRYNKKAILVVALGLMIFFVCVTLFLLA